TPRRWAPCPGPRRWNAGSTCRSAGPWSSSGSLPSMTPLVGDLTGCSVDFGEARYLLNELLGVGGMGEVYLARRMGDAGLGEWSTSDLAAVKVVRRDVAAYLGGNARTFADEIRLHRHLSHPNIVPVRGVTEENGTLYMMMEYLEGNDLRTLLRLAEEQGTRLS